MNFIELKNPTNTEISNTIENMTVFETINIMTDSIMQDFGIDNAFSLELSIMKIPEGFLYTTYGDDSHSTVFVPNS